MIKVTVEQLSGLANQQGLLQKLQGNLHGDNKASYRLMKIIKAVKKNWEDISKKENDNWQNRLKEAGVMDSAGEMKKRKEQVIKTLPYPTKATVDSGPDKGKEILLDAQTRVMSEEEVNDVEPGLDKQLAKEFQDGREALQNREVEIALDPIPFDFFLNSKHEFSPAEIEAVEPFCSEDAQGLWLDAAKRGDQAGKVSQLRR